MVDRLSTISTKPVPTVELWVEGFGGDVHQGTWVEQPWVWCVELSRVALPTQGTSRATLEWNYGEISRNENDFQVVSPLDWNGKWIRLKITGDSGGTVYWAGVVIATEDVNYTANSGAPFDGGFDDGFEGDAGEAFVSPEKGDLVLEVAGPDWVLSKLQINSTLAYDTLSNPVIVNRGVAFNLVTGRTRRANRTIEANKRIGLLGFATSLDSAYAEVWTGKDILDYLRSYLILNHEDAAGEAYKVPDGTWETQNTDVADWFEPIIETDGRTIYDIISEVASYQRGLAWSVEYQEDVSFPDDLFGTFRIAFKTATASTINLPSGGSIPGNTETVELWPQDHEDAETFVVTDVQQTFRQVVVQGARIGAVHTFDFLNGLTIGWTGAQQSAYNDPSGEPGYPNSTDLSVNEAWIENHRRYHPDYSGVYTRFIVLPQFDIANEVFDGEEVYFPGLRFEKKTPLLKNVDYSSLLPSAVGSVDNSEFVELFAVYTDQGGFDSGFSSGYSSQKYVMAHELQKNDGDNELTGYDWSSTVRPLETEFGVEVKPEKANHLHAAGSFGASETSYKLTPQLDFQGMFITGYFFGDKRVEGVWPDPAITPPHLYVDSTLYIRLGDVAFYDTMAAGTIVGVQNSGLVRTIVDQAVRDDRGYLKDVARMAGEWYTQPRVAARLGYRQILDDIKPGMILTLINGQNADAIVTEVTYNFNNGTTAIGTTYAEPDFGLLAR